MVSVAEATAIIQNYLWESSIEKVPLLASMGRILGDAVKADRDFPPYDRVTMDGIAIAFGAYQNGLRKFKMEGIQSAGLPQKSLLSIDSCLEVMTGAILPHGCDTVIRYEDIKIENGFATITIDNIKNGESIHRQGNDARQGDVVLKKGTLISSAEIPLLASVGISAVPVMKLPKTAIVSTGNELVDVDQQPEAHQVRRSNVYALAAALKRQSITASLFHLLDDEVVIKTGLQKILDDHDLIILSGGVSKGKFDLIPPTLEANGIQKHFHQVKQRPGKPMWFGTGINKKTVFALPGNPVSTYLCYYKYVDPWLQSSLGSQCVTSKAILGDDFTFEPQLNYFLQASIKNEDGRIIASPVAGGGSGDFINLTEVDGFVELPAEGTLYKKGESFNFISFRN